MTALAEVQHTSTSAFISAVVLTSATDGTPGCLSLSSARPAGSIMAAMGHNAPLEGISTVFSGESILALSAMKSTPQNTITSASVFDARMLRSSESPT